MSDERIAELLTELEQLGEDPEELAYWRSVWPDMEPDQQAELLASLEKELVGLKKAAGVAVSPDEERRVVNAKADMEAARHDASEEQIAHIKESI